MWAESTPTSVGASHSRGSSVQWQWYLQELCTLPGKFHRTGQCLVLQTFLGNSEGHFPDEVAMHTPYKGLIGRQSRLCLCMCHSHAHKHNSPPCALPQNGRQLCAPQCPSNCFPKADALKVSVANAHIIHLKNTRSLSSGYRQLCLCKQVVEEVQRLQLNILHTEE